VAGARTGKLFQPHSMVTKQSLSVCIWSATKSRYSRVERSGTLNTGTENAGQKKNARPYVTVYTRASFLDTCEHGPSRSAVDIVNDVIIIFYLQDGCPKWLFTGRVYGP